MPVKKRKIQEKRDIELTDGKTTDIKERAMSSKPWQPPKGASIPEHMKDKDMHYYLARPENVPKYIEQGYVVDTKMTEEYRRRSSSDTLAGTPLGSNAEYRGLVTMKIPKESIKQKRAYYDKLNNQHMTAKGIKERLKDETGDYNSNNIYGDVTTGVSTA